MSVQLSIVEKIVGRSDRQAFSIRLASERVPAREIVASHVRTQVEALNDHARRNRDKHDRVASFLVGPHSHETERKLNPKRGVRTRLLDTETEIKAAHGGVEAKQVIMLFDDREVTDLDELLTVTDDSTVTFLRLVPLIGG